MGEYLSGAELLNQGGATATDSSQQFFKAAHLIATSKKWKRPVSSDNI